MNAEMHTDSLLGIRRTSDTENIKFLAYICTYLRSPLANSFKKLFL
jgi:hypothetical protein